jgi:hypothetical protein
MQAQQAIMTFSEAERPTGDRLLKIAIEIDRVEGYSEAHAIAIARMAEKIGAQMGLHGVDLTALKFAALAHDLGERAMKRNYLLRPSALSWEETLDLWRHPILGEQAAGELKLSRQAQLLIRWHHEWWNGQGYPDGLAGETIPVGARILRAVDSYFALASDRPHRPRLDRLEAEQVIADLAGIEFDPWIAKLLLAILTEERGGWPDAGEAAIRAAPSAPETVVAFVEPELDDHVIRESAIEIAETVIYYDEPDEPRIAIEIEPTPVDLEQLMESPEPIFEPADESEPAAHNDVIESPKDSADAERQNLSENHTDEANTAPEPKVEN